MNDYIKQLNPYLSGENLIEKLTILPKVNEVFENDGDRLLELLNIYKLFIPSKYTIDIYSRMYLSVISSLEKKETIDEVILQNDNYKSMNGIKRYGVVGGLESFEIVARAGYGKTSSVQICSDLISENKILVNEKTGRKIIPILFVECVADCSFKALLYSILKEIDNKIGTNYFNVNRRSTTTIDILLSCVSNVLINHVGLLVIDEIERMANDSKRGETLLNYLVQLVNQSNVSICFVGNESANKFFKMKEYMSRRTIGININKMNYDDYFFKFCSVLFRYQYTKSKVETNGEILRTLYKYSNGSVSMLVTLFVEAQRRAILNGINKISSNLIKETFDEVFSNMKCYIEKNETNIISNKEEVKEFSQINVNNNELDLFSKIFKNSGKDLNIFINFLKNKISVEEI